MDVPAREAGVVLLDLLDRPPRDVLDELPHGGVGDAHRLAVLLIGSLGDADGVARALGHPHGAVGTHQDGIRDAHTSLLAVDLL
jgi:hypothetical protein